MTTGLKLALSRMGFILAIALLLPACDGLLKPTVQAPVDIPLEELIAAQLKELGPTWFNDRSQLYTGDDFTKAMWAHYIKLDNDDYRYGASEEIHVFSSTALAALWGSSPSPRSVNIDKGKDMPEGWSYVPVYADQFILDCSPEKTPDFCYFLLRYQKYSVVYGTDVAGVITLDDLQRLIRVTDEFMNDFIAETTLKRSTHQLPTG